MVRDEMKWTKVDQMRRNEAKWTEWTNWTKMNQVDPDGPKWT